VDQATEAAISEMLNGFFLNHQNLHATLHLNAEPLQKWLAISEFHFNILSNRCFFCL